MRATAVFAIVFALHCTRVPPPKPVPPAHATSREVTLYVHVSEVLPLETVEGAEVIAIGRGGEMTRVATTFNGIGRISKARLRELNATVLLICQPFFHCGAIRIDESHLLDYDDYYIDLARLTLY
jgi:hypothetical protein